MFTSDVDVSLGAYAGKFQPGRNAVGTDVQLSALATAQHAVLADTNELRKARDLDDLGKQRQALIGLPNESIVPPRNDDLPSDTMDITLAHVNKMMSAKTRKRGYPGPTRFGGSVGAPSSLSLKARLRDS